MTRQRPERVTMRTRIMADEDRPRFVRGNDATPDKIGEPDDVAWAIAQELEAFFYEQKIATGKSAAWLFKRGGYALDRSMIRDAYKNHPERFRDGDGRQLTLAQFGRNIVRYFKRHFDWAYCANADEVIGMFYDSVTLDECTRGLWRVYKNRRIRKGIE